MPAAAAGGAAVNGADNLLVRRLLEQRRRWVPLPGSPVEVQVQRPAEAELGPFLVDVPGGRSLRVELPQVQACVVDWRGMTEAQLLGASVGSEDSVPFTRDLWAPLVADRLDWVRAVADALVEMVLQHYESQAAARGN